MRIPTFSRQSHTATETEHRAPVAARTDTPKDAPTGSGSDSAPTATGRATADPDRTVADRAVPDHTVPDHTVPDRTVPDRSDRDLAGRTPTPRGPGESTAAERLAERDDRPAGPPVAAGPKPRASLLATFALITGVAGALLVLSGPLLGYGIGVAGLALVLAIAGIRATGRRHVAGKTDALIGMVLALTAIVVGILALTGSLSWLGTDMQPVSDLRQWLDSQFATRF
ncbi:Yip1 family protein [Actinoplanes sp. NPDC051346]|uniref:Yip1 family protein n=1 Tax=Actinoplanes sp. NPDC051346 TaxID=3155048 RepID=UPI003421100A